MSSHRSVAIVLGLVLTACAQGGAALGGAVGEALDARIGGRLGKEATRAVRPQVNRAMYPSSGGPTLAQAQRVDLGTTVEGVASKDQRRFYAVRLRAGQTLEMTWYSQIIASGAP